MENIKLPHTWQQESEEVNNRRPVDVVLSSDILYKNGFRVGAQSMLTAIEKQVKIDLGLAEGHLKSENIPATVRLHIEAKATAYNQILQSLKSIQP